jgi:hypothetical protein
MDPELLRLIADYPSIEKIASQHSYGRLFEDVAGVTAFGKPDGTKDGPTMGLLHVWVTSDLWR